MGNVDLYIDELRLFRGDSFRVNDYITVLHPTIGQITEFEEQKYLEIVSLITSIPSDFKSELYDLGIDYINISEYDFFLSRCSMLSQEIGSILFGEFDFSKLERKQIQDTKDLVLADLDGHTVLGEIEFSRIADFVRRINFLTKDVEKYAAGDEQSRQYLIDKDRRKKMRRKKDFKSQFKPLLSALVNCGEFKCDYKSVFEMPIYTFNDSVRQIQKYKDYENLMTGIYTGSIDTKKLPNKNDLCWINFAG